MAIRAGDIISLGTWPQELEGPALPLFWRVLEVRPDGSALLLCRDIIECRSYHDHKGDITWQNCTLRYWLNQVFFAHAFSPLDQRRLKLEKCPAENNRAFRTVGGGDTEDYVFCLGFDQVNSLFSADVLRQARPTTYAQRASSTSWWWLRSPGGHQFAAATIAESGQLDYNGFHASLDCIGVRPAVVLAPVPSQEEPAEADAPAFTHAGMALRYGAAEEVPELLRRERLRAETAEMALSGGNPSIQAIRLLFDQGVFSDSDCLHLCHAAIRGGAGKLALMFIDVCNFEQDRLSRLLKAAVERGDRTLTQALLAQGACGEGYAAAYLKAGVREASALCAFLADPQGAMARWDVVRQLPAVARFVVTDFLQRGQVQLVAQLPDILQVLAAANCLAELRTLTAAMDVAQLAFSCEDYVDAIERAKLAGHGATVAYLLDQHAVKFGGPGVTGRPNLAL